MLPSLIAALLCASSAHAALLPAQQQQAVNVVVKPKVFIVSMFAPEAEIWYGIPEFNILALNVTVLAYPRCSRKCTVLQMEMSVKW